MPTDDDLILDHLLIALRASCIANRDDTLDSMQFSDDLAYPISFPTRCIMHSIRALLEYFSDSTCNDLAEHLDELFPEG